MIPYFRSFKSKSKPTSDGSSRVPRRRKPPPKRWGFCPAATLLLLMGQPLLLLALWDFAARLYAYETAGAIGYIHLLEDFGGSFSAASVILWGVALWLDLQERRLTRRK